MINQQTYSDWEIEVIYVVHSIVRERTGEGELFFDRKALDFEVIFEWKSLNAGFVYCFHPLRHLPPQCIHFEQQFLKFMSDRARGYKR